MNPISEKVYFFYKFHLLLLINECVAVGKYNKGRKKVGVWVFGGVERGTKRCFLVPVPNRTRPTLLAIIKEWILPGTTIISDEWGAYKCLKYIIFTFKLIFIHTLY